MRRTHLRDGRAVGARRGQLGGPAGRVPGGAHRLGHVAAVRHDTDARGRRRRAAGLGIAGPRRRRRTRRARRGPARGGCGAGAQGRGTAGGEAFVDADVVRRAARAVIGDQQRPAAIRVGRGGAAGLRGTRARRSAPRCPRASGRRRAIGRRRRRRRGCRRGCRGRRRRGRRWGGGRGGRRAGGAGGHAADRVGTGTAGLHQLGDVRGRLVGVTVAAHVVRLGRDAAVRRRRRRDLHAAHAGLVGVRRVAVVLDVRGGRERAAPIEAGPPDRGVRREDQLAPAGRTGGRVAVDVGVRAVRAAGPVRRLPAGDHRGAGGGQGTGHPQVRTRGRRGRQRVRRLGVVWGTRGRADRARRRGRRGGRRGSRRGRTGRRRDGCQRQRGCRGEWNGTDQAAGDDGDTGHDGAAASPPGGPVG